MKLKLILSFDHELPLGGVRTSYKEAMFDPTDRLFDLAKEIDVPVVLFTDILCAYRFREWDHNNFFKPYAKQLKTACIGGHDVQLHLHPHWLTSKFENQTFIPSRDYKLADFIGHSIYPTDKIVKTGCDLLNEILLTDHPEYKCLAFRAGGYNLEGDTSKIVNSLLNHGIQYESSIIKGYYFRSGLSEIDFRRMPAQPNWFIGTDGRLDFPSAAGLLEVPIASIPKTPFEVPTRFKLKKLAHQAPRDHGYQIHEGNPTDVVSKIKMLFSARMLSFDNYTLDVAYLLKILEYNVRKYREYESVILSVSGHPKSMGDYSFKLMRDFVLQTRKLYPGVEFTTFQKLANPLSPGSK